MCNEFCTQNLFILEMLSGLLFLLLLPRSSESYRGPGQGEPGELPHKQKGGPIHRPETVLYFCWHLECQRTESRYFDFI